MGERPAQLVALGEARVQQVEREARPGARRDEVAHRPPLVVVHVAAERGGELKGHAIVGPAVGQQALHGRHPHRVDVVGDQPLLTVGEHEARRARGEDPPLDPVAHEVHREQGVAGRAGRDLRGEGPREVQQPLDQLLAFVGRERGDGHRLGPGVVEDAVHEVPRGRARHHGVPPQGPEHQDRRRLHALPIEQVGGELERVVAPLEVVEEQEDGESAGLPLEHPPHEHVALAGRRESDPGRPGLPLLLGAGGDDLREGGHLVGVVDPVALEQLLDAIGRLDAVEPGRPERAPDHGAEPVGGAVEVRVGRLEHRHRAELVGALGDPLDQAGLAEARAALEQDHPGDAVAAKLTERPPDPVALGPAPDQGHGPQPVQREAGADDVHRAARRGRALPRAGERDQRPGRARDRGHLPAREGVEVGGGVEGDRRRLPVGADPGELVGRRRGVVGEGGGDRRDRAVVHRLAEVAQVVGGHRGPLVASAGLLLEEPQQPVLQPVGDGEARQEGRRLAEEVGLDHGLEIGLHEGQLAGDEAPREAADGVQIRPRPVVPPAPRELLRGHVLHGAREVFAETGPAPLVDGVGRAEVGELDARPGVVGAGQEHVGGLDVPVDHAPGVRVGEGVQHPQADRLELLPPGDHGAAERPPGRELHDEVRGPRLQAALRGRGRLVGDGPVVEHQDDPRVIEPGHGPDLVVEGVLLAPVSELLGGHHLDRHRRALRDVLALPHLAHAAAADRRVQDERPHGDGVRRGDVAPERGDRRSSTGGHGPEG